MMIKQQTIKLLVLLIVSIFNVLFSSVFANECLRAIQTISKQEKIPQDILIAVSLTETGTMQKGRLAPYPWAINVRGKGYLFSSKQKAIQAVKSYFSQGITSVDIGCMQLNWYWHKDKFDSSLEKAFDPIHNVKSGTQYIQEHYRTYKNWDKAVGRYHSGTEKFAKLYRQKYSANLKIAQNETYIMNNMTNGKNDDSHINSNNSQLIKLAVLSQSAGSLITFKPADNTVTALINLHEKPFPIIDTRRKRPFF